MTAAIEPFSLHIPDSERDVIHWNELDRGGHFAALEQPELFVAERRTCFAQFH